VKNPFGNINSKKIIDWLLVFTFPFLFFISHYYLHILIWVAFVPAIILLARNNFVYSWLYIIITSIITSVLATFFVSQFKYEYFVLSSIFFATVLIISFLVCWFCYRKIKWPFSVLIMPIVWLIVLNAVSFVDSGGFLFDISSMQPMLFPLTWIFGNQGMAFLVMLFNSLVAFYFLTRDKKILKYIAATILVLAVCFAFSYFAVSSGKKVKIALIQGNVARDWQWRIENSNTTIFDTYKSLTLEAAKSHPDIIIWPEFAIPADINDDPKIYKEIAELAKTSGAYLIFGSTGRTEKTDPAYNYIKDVIHIISKEGERIGSYTAVLPFPYNGYIIPGKELPVFSTDIGRFGITACTEETYGSFNKNYALSGADFFINVSNDEPIKSLRVRWLKSMYSRFSAAENNKYLVRVANTGYTFIANPYGKIVAQLEPNKEGILIGDIYLK